uniref:Uncharacterized protein n=1 Tax=Arundo donax TaxID=35708 RepID=A0A0A9BRL9_ARUDO
MQFPNSLTIRRNH